MIRHFKALFVALLFAAALNAQSKINLSIPLPILGEPVLHVETINLVACPTPALLPCTALPAGTTGTYTYTLAAAPIASLGAVVSFASSQVGGDVYAAIPGVQPSIQFTVPAYPAGAAFTTSDVITISYFSTR